MLACLCSSVHAAHWVVTYQGSGTTSGTDTSGQPASQPWNSGGSCMQGYLGWAKGNISGTIVPVLTWTKDNADTLLPPAPTQSIAQIASSANINLYVLYGTGTPTAAASDSLGDTGLLVTTSTPGSYNEASCQFSGTHYLMVDNPMAQTTVMMKGITILLSASGSGVNPDGSGNFNLTVTAFPVTINLAGTTPDASGNLNILVGQGCTASLSGLPAFATAPGNTTTYLWLNNGVTFQSWSATTPPIGTAPANPNASYYVGGMGVQNHSTDHWYWNDLKNTTEIVTGFATLRFPLFYVPLAK